MRTDEVFLRICLLDKSCNESLRLQSESWTASDDFLENIFSLEHGPLDFLGDSMPDFNLCPENVSQPSEAISSSCSDSGLSSDHAEL